MQCRTRNDEVGMVDDENVRFKTENMFVDEKSTPSHFCHCFPTNLMVSLLFHEQIRDQFERFAVGN